MNTQGIISILALTASLIGFNTVQAHDRETRHASHNTQQQSHDSHQRSTRNRDHHQRDNDRSHLRQKQRRISSTAIYLKHKYQHKQGISHRHPSNFSHSHKSWRKHHARWDHQNSRRHVRNDASHDYYQRRRDYKNHDRYNYRSRYYW